MVHVDALMGAHKGFHRIVAEASQFPGVRVLAKPVYRRLFERPFQEEACYFGVYDSYAAAAAAAPAQLPKSYDVATSGRLYHDLLDRIRVSDYPMIHWISRLLADGNRKVFDLGGHVGVSYYGFGRYIDYPPDMDWLIHDVGPVVKAGRRLAEDRDERKQLHFTDSRTDVEGRDILIACGSLQYLDYTLDELVRPLRDRPPHVLVNMTPMHDQHSFFTLQNIGFAVCPYRVSAVPDFIAAMEGLGYVLEDRWDSYERQLRVPFFEDHEVPCYRGFYFRLGDSSRKAGSRGPTRDATTPRETTVAR